MMESPVRICLGAALVVHLLLLSSTAVRANSLPEETTTTIFKDDRPTRYSRNNSTWNNRSRHKTADVALNELNPKESEENTDKNEKSKQRGRVRFSSQYKTSSEPSIKRRSPTTRTTTTSTTMETPKVMIITPTPEVKKPIEIMTSMRTFKKKKMPSSTASPDLTSQSTEEDYDDNNSFEKYTSDHFHKGFTIPSYSKNGRGVDHSRNKVNDNSSPSFNYFSSDDSREKDNYSAFNFASELTTPKNDFFDKKFNEIQSSIIKNLDAIEAKRPASNNSHKILKQNIGLEKLNNGTPNNKSTVIFKNTKEIRLFDNEKEGTSNKELSDVQGTSIYYEMSVLSTETYALNNDDDDCDDAETTPATTAEQENAASNTTQSTVKTTTPNDTDWKESIDTLASNYLHYPSSIPYSSVSPISYSSISPISSQNQERNSTTEKSRFTGRNKSYAKRLNFTGSKDSLNGVTTKALVSVRTTRPPSRRFHHTTPKVKPVWMAPRRNITKTYHRPTYPTTIYQEYFDIKDKYSSTEKPDSKKVLSTVSSEIDPVLQTDVSGIKKIVSSNAISDNSIPSLWKRGSTKFTTSTASSSSENSDVNEMEIPPTLTAWALASLRSPPSISSSVVNVTTSTHKSVDENELQKVGEISDKKISTASFSTTPNPLINDVVTSKINEIDQNKLSWQQIFSPSSSVETHAEVKVNDTRYENEPAKPSSADIEKDVGADEQLAEAFTESNEKTTQHEENETDDDEEQEAELSSTKATGFESITKLPSGVTTPQDDPNPSEESSFNKVEHTTDDYKITTIRFSYVPTEPNTTEELVTETTTQSSPSKVNTTFNDVPITTYRPKYMNTLETEEEQTSTTAEETTGTNTPVTETERLPETTEKIVEQTTEHPTEAPTTTLITTTFTTGAPVSITTVDTTTLSAMEETTSTVFQIVTEINRAVETTPIVASTEDNILNGTSQSSETVYSSEENNEVIKPETTQTTIPKSTTVLTTISVTTTEASTTELQDVELHTTEASTTELKEVELQTSVAPTHAKSEEIETTTEINAKISETTTQVRDEVTIEDTADETTKSVSGLEDITSYSGEVTTEASTRLLTDESGSGAAIAIAVSTIGVIALILLVGLLLVVRRRGRRGAYAHRCTPVSLDAYSLDSVSVGQRKGQRVRTSKRSYGNPAYDDEVTSHPMQYPALANFAQDIESITAEFSEIPSVAVRPDEVPPGCEDKNRYSNVLPLPETRVPLARIGNDPTTEYINANYITGPGNIKNYYIACQAPLESTVADFWRMIWEQNSRVVVMLTEYMENGVEKCYEYLPPSEISDNRRTFGEFQIILKKREQKDKYAISGVQLINLTTRTWREITHLWYFWPAKGVPDDYDSVIDFLSEMRAYMKISQAAKEYDEDGVEVIYEDDNRSSFQNLSNFREDNGSSNGVNVYSPAKAEEQLRRGNGTLSRMKAASEHQPVRPCVVVCASGAGRTGALLAAALCARALLAAGRVDVPRCVRDLRAQRPHALANKHHYIFLYKLLSEYGNKLMGGGIDTI